MTEVELRIINGLEKIADEIHEHNRTMRDIAAMLYRDGKRHGASFPNRFDVVYASDPRWHETEGKPTSKPEEPEGNITP